MKLPKTYIRALKAKGFKVTEEANDVSLIGTTYTIEKPGMMLCVESGDTFEEFKYNLDRKSSDFDMLFEDADVPMSTATKAAEIYASLLNLTEMYYKKVHLLKKQLNIPIAV